MVEEEEEVEEVEVEVEVVEEGAGRRTGGATWRPSGDESSRRARPVLHGDSFLMARPLTPFSRC